MATVFVTPPAGVGCAHLFESHGMSGPIPVDQCPACGTRRYDVPEYQLELVVMAITQAASAERIEAHVAWDRRSS